MALLTPMVDRWPSVLLKASNDDQRRIVDKIQASSGVLVQPPALGNPHHRQFDCHFFAADSELTTAKTPRALQVLEGLVPKELRFASICLEVV
jgi:hypothetical protein